MRIAASRFFTGPNLHDDVSGLVIETELDPLPPAGQPIGLAPLRVMRILGRLGFAELRERWQAAADRGRRAVPGPLLRLAGGLLVPWSVAPPGGTVIGCNEARAWVFLRCATPAVGRLAWACACRAFEACLSETEDLGPLAAAHAAFLDAAAGISPAATAIAREAGRRGVPAYPVADAPHVLRLGQGHRGRRVPHAAISEPLAAAETWEARAAATLASQFAPGEEGRIPTCAITGSLGKTTTANMVARILAGSGLTVGRCTTTGLWIGAERVRAGDCAGGRFARDLMLDGRVQAGVFELARGGLLAGGMVIEDCMVGAVLNILDNHLGADGIESREDLARIKSIVARRARRALVLNAEDPLCLAMQERAMAERIVLVGRQDGPALRAHREAGGCGVALETAAGDAHIVRFDRGAAEIVLDLAAVPATLGGRHGGKAWNALFAVAIAGAMGASLGDIRAALRAFRPDLADSQGRFSVIDWLPFRVILDHATGREATGELAACVRAIPVSGRRLVYVMASGRMSPALVRATGHALAGTFDLHVCTSWSKRPAPEPGLVPSLLRDGLLEGGAAAASILCIEPEEAALRRVLREARAEDLVVVITAEMDAAVATMRELAGPVDRVGDVC